VILKSCTLSRTSDTTETGNPCVIKVIYFLIYLISSDNNFCFYAEVNFWDFARNDNSNKGTTAGLNETRFCLKNKSSPIYLGPKNLDTFWCTGWAWNCQIIFSLDIRFRTFGFDVIIQWRQNMCCVIFRVWVSHEGKYCTKFLNHYSFICSKFYKLYKYNISQRYGNGYLEIRKMKVKDANLFNMRALYGIKCVLNIF
jgi:hypothetical protein